MTKYFEGIIKGIIVHNLLIFGLKHFISILNAQEIDPQDNCL